MSDFVSVADSGVLLVAIDDDSDTDFIDIGDNGVNIVSATGFGDGGFGDGPFGGGTVLIISSSPTAWTNIDTP